MHWQDIVLSFGAWVFVAALVPSVFGTDKPAFSSSLVTALILTSFAATYASMGLRAAAVSSFALALTWGILAWQKRRSAVE